MCLMSGCRSRHTQFQVTNFGADGQRESFFEGFNECYYTIDPSGNVDIVARRLSDAGDDVQGEICQIVHIRTVYRNVPGAMASDKTMINALINYAILAPDGGSSYEGAGFVYFRKSMRRRELRGALELSTVRPHRRVGEPIILFDRAELTGEFVAQENRRKVVHLFNQLRRVFGKMPRFQPNRDGDVM